MTGQRMDRQTWGAIIKKLASEVKVRALIPSLYGDAMLHPEFPQFIRDCAPHRFPYIVVPTTLNRLNCDIRDVLSCGIHEMAISWSGWDHYTEYHKGGNIDTVTRNMELIASVKDKPNISVRFHRFKHNAHEEPAARAYCEKLGFQFDPVNTFLFDVEDLVHNEVPPARRAWIEDNLVVNPWEFADKNRGDKNCPQQNRHLTISTSGMAQVCSCINNRVMDIGDFLTTPLSTIKRIQRHHPWCERCKQSGFRYAYKIFPDEV